MFRWYRNSSICIAYLAESSTADDLEKDVWFTRGWTLQELIAPRKMKFFGKGWIPLSSCESDKVSPEDFDWNPSRPSPSEIMNRIVDITKIPLVVLSNFEPELEAFEEKMLWASTRTTTRVEDIAYSLLGILDVSIPIAYGEGRKAFFRLMQAVIEDTTDAHIFSWTGTASPYCSALPISPSCYSRARAARSAQTDLNHHEFVFGDATFFMSKMKLNIKVLLVPVHAASKKHGDNGTDMFTFRDPSGVLEGFTAVFRTRQLYHLKCYTTKNLAVGILDYVNEDGKTQILSDFQPYAAFLLTCEKPQEWLKVNTVNMIEVYPRQTLEKDTVALQLSKKSMESLPYHFDGKNVSVQALFS